MKVTTLIFLLALLVIPGYWLSGHVMVGACHDVKRDVCGESQRAFNNRLTNTCITRNLTRNNKKNCTGYELYGCGVEVTTVCRVSDHEFKSFTQLVSGESMSVDSTLLNSVESSYTDSVPNQPMGVDDEW